VASSWRRLVGADFPGVHKLSDNVDRLEMQGALMRSPLSQRTCNFDIGTLRSYVDGRCESLNGAGCQEFIKVFRGMRVAPILHAMLVSESKQSKSYDYFIEYLQRPDCEWIFCRQLSDQLVICEECGERPILYNVLKDEDAMQRHLNHHHAESDARAALMNTLVAEVQASCLLERATGVGPGNQPQVGQEKVKDGRDVARVDWSQCMVNSSG